MEELLHDEGARRVVRVGDTVRRPAQTWTPAVHELLEHLRSVGFTRAPRPLGLDGQGREVLGYIEGQSGPAGWSMVISDEGLAAFARLLRDLHAATAEFVPSPGGPWAEHFGARGSHQIVCHGDFGPWNAVWRGGLPVGVIDWDLVHHGTRVDDVAYALEYVAPFRADEESVRWLRYPEPPDRAERLERFCAAYGVPSTEGMVSAVIDRQRATITRVRRLAEAGVQPQERWVREGRLAELETRVEWSRAHRHLFGPRT